MGRGSTLGSTTASRHFPPPVLGVPEWLDQLLGLELSLVLLHTPLFLESVLWGLALAVVSQCTWLPIHPQNEHFDNNSLLVLLYSDNAKIPVGVIPVDRNSGVTHALFSPTGLLLFTGYRAVSQPIASYCCCLVMYCCLVMRLVCSVKMKCLDLQFLVVHQQSFFQ